MLFECKVIDLVVEVFLWCVLMYLMINFFDCEVVVVNECVIKVVGLFYGGYGKGLDLVLVLGMVWGLFNSVIEYVDYYWCVCSDDYCIDVVWFGVGVIFK